MNIITVLPHQGYINQVIRDVREVYREDVNNKICYVTLNKPHTSFFEALNSEKANLDRWFVIDAITKSVIKNPSGPYNCAFVNSPIDFDEVLSKVDELLETNKFGAVIFDSVCSLFSHGESEEVIDFLKKLSARISLAKCEGVFIALKNNISLELLNQLNSVADKIIQINNN